MGFTFLNHQFDDATFSNAETNIELLERASHLKNIIIYKIHVPLGWHELVMDYLSDLSKMRGTKTIYHLYARHAALESKIEIDYRNKLTTPFELMHKYREMSLDACYGCGNRTARGKVVQQTVISLCKLCQEATDASGHTGTWLDSV